MKHCGLRPSFYGASFHRRDLGSEKKKSLNLVERMKLLMRMYLKACATFCGKNVEWKLSPQAPDISWLKSWHEIVRLSFDDLILPQKKAIICTTPGWEETAYGRYRWHSQNPMVGIVLWFTLAERNQNLTWIPEMLVIFAGSIGIGAWVQINQQYARTLP